MVQSDAWRTLTDGDNSQGIVLAIDFDVTGRSEARFSDLAANLKTDYEVRETVHPAPRARFARTGAGYVDHWARQIEAERSQVRALLGFCAGSVYAAALAERISGWQDAEPLLLLFDPEITVAQTLLWQFHKIAGFMSSLIPAADVAGMREAGQQKYAENPQLSVLKVALIRLMREIGDPALARAGLDQPRREELLDIIDSCMFYLAAASEIDPLDRWRSAIAFSSSTPLSGLRGMRLSGRQISVAREISVNADHGTLLADTDVAVTVSDLLNG